MLGLLAFTKINIEVKAARLKDITSLKFFTKAIIIKQPNMNKIIGILFPLSSIAVELIIIIKNKNSLLKLLFLFAVFY